MSPEATPPDAQVAQDVALLLDENARARAALHAAIEGVPEARLLDRWFEGWSLREIIAHVAAWEDGFAAALESAVRGERPVIPGYENGLDDATDRFNARVVAALGETPWTEIRMRLQASAARHDAALRSVAASLTADRFEAGRSARRLASAARHYEEHTPDILAWRRREGI